MQPTSLGGHLGLPDLGISFVQARFPEHARGRVGQGGVKGASGGGGGRRDVIPHRIPQRSNSVPLAQDREQQRPQGSMLWQEAQHTWWPPRPPWERFCDATGQDPARRPSWSFPAGRKQPRGRSRGGCPCRGVRSAIVGHLGVLPCSPRSTAEALAANVGSRLPHVIPKPGPCRAVCLASLRLPPERRPRMGGWVGGVQEGARGVGVQAGAQSR